MKLKKIVSILFIALLFSACSASPKNAAKSSEQKDMGFVRDEASPAPTENFNPSVTKNEYALVKPTTNIGDKIIYTIGLELETKQYSETVQSIETLTHSLNGYVQTSSIPRHRDEEKYNGLTAYFTIMIPTDKIDEFISSAGEVSNIVNESRNALNITEAYSDTQSRISALKTKEARLLDLLKQSGTLADLLQIETELSNTRYEIEALETTIKSYDNRIAYTQFNITVTEVYTYSPAKRDGLWERIADEFSNNLQNFVWSVENLFIFLVSTLPFVLVQLLVLAVPLVIIYLVYRKVTGKRLPSSRRKKNEDSSIKNDEQQ